MTMTRWSGKGPAARHGCIGVAALMCGTLGLLTACGTEPEPTGQRGVGGVTDATDVVRIDYEMRGLYAGDYVVLTDGTTRSRTTGTSDFTADGSVEAQKGWFEVWVRTTGGRFDRLEYDPDRTLPYQQSKGLTPEENPLRVYRPTDDELQALCNHAQNTGTEQIAGRTAVHYSCTPFGGDRNTTDIWLDEVAGWMLKQTYDDGTTLLAIRLDPHPTLDDDTFSTDLPAGVEEFAEPFHFRLPRVGGGQVDTSRYEGGPLLVVTGDAAGIRAMVARLAPMTDKPVVGLLIAIPPPNWEGSLLNAEDARSLTEQISNAAGSFPIPVAIDVKGSAGMPILEPAGIPVGGTRPTAVGLIRSDQGLAQVLTERATNEELRRGIAKLS
jgi:hypothetical protein